MRIFLFILGVFAAVACFEKPAAAQNSAWCAYLNFEAAPRCLLLAQSGHCHRAERCPLLGVKRTLAGHVSMSAFDPKRT